MLFKTKHRIPNEEAAYFVVGLRDHFYSMILQDDKVTSGIVSFDKRVPTSLRSRSLPLDWNGWSQTLRIDEEVIQIVEKGILDYLLQYRGGLEKLRVYTPQQWDLLQHAPVSKEGEAGKELIAPMPGLIKSINVSDGDEVLAEAELLVIEAMKMQNVFKAEKAAKVKKVNFKEGDSCAVDDVLIEFE